ncbi:M48 family metallopeptidase [Acidovorax sp. Be4]|uniref:M48 family metallopeptidase n=1 Tax=Acidovorax bellezanensis TaxID=2976702 RepID=A0ABT2PJH0_9BURK|nr:SprT family zinc-dependent metalloprotease [Acidovorax sp. Be4]MCT9810380.1 M48 family metallopeptidase [Acidovorax sp. Be4]
MAGLLQRAWDWLAPPQVPLVDGQLVKRQRRSQPPASPQPLQTALDFVAPSAAPAPVAVPAAEPPAPSPVAFHHPQASHQLQLAGIAVGYLLERSRRRSIGMTVCAQGLRVRAPLGVGHGAVERVLRDKADWIVRKLAEQQQRSQQSLSARIAWDAQAQLPYLGRSLHLQPLAPGQRPPAALLPCETGCVLQLPLPVGASADQIRAAVHAWWLRAARSHFAERLDHFAPLLGVQWRSLRLSSARTRWGSARSDGSIRLNWRLMHYAPEVIDYVVVHELSHLHHMDHSPRFWATVAGVLPDYRALRQQLRDQPAPQWSETEFTP